MFRVTRTLTTQQYLTERELEVFLDDLENNVESDCDEVAVDKDNQLLRLFIRNRENKFIERIENGE